MSILTAVALSNTSPLEGEVDIKATLGFDVGRGGGVSIRLLLSASFGGHGHG